MAADPVAEPSSTAPLVGRLLAVLEEQDVTYCHWKSNNALDRSASGENDLDLLVAQSSVDHFTSALRECHFNEARPGPRRQLPGVFDYYGYDAEIDVVIHVHAHYQLVIGDDYTKNYHLAIEGPFLASSRKQGLFRIPSAEFEYVVFVIRMMLKHGVWESPIVGRRRLSTSELREAEYLEACVDSASAAAILQRHVPSLSPQLFDECVRMLHADPAWWHDLKTGRQFMKSMEGSARRPRWRDILLKIWRRFWLSLRWRLLHVEDKRRPASGGAIIAIVGGDGSGKTTAVEGVCRWLSRYFDTRVIHMGKPRWSLATVFVLGLMKTGRMLRILPDTEATLDESPPTAVPSDDVVELVRQTLTARDRFLTYRRARRFADNGGLVIADRYPLPQVKSMDGGASVVVSEGDHAFPGDGVTGSLARRLVGYYLASGRRSSSSSCVWIPRSPSSARSTRQRRQCAGARPRSGRSIGARPTPTWWTPVDRAKKCCGRSSATCGPHCDVGDSPLSA